MGHAINAQMQKGKIMRKILTSTVAWLFIIALVLTGLPVYAEVQELTKPVYAWNFDEGFGTISQDAGKSHSNMNINNTDNWVTLEEGGFAFSPLVPAAQYAIAPYALSYGKPFSISSWFMMGEKPEGTWAMIVADCPYDGTNPPQFDIQINSVNKIYFEWIGTSYGLEFPEVVQPNVWHNVVAVYDGKDIVGYLDGVEQARDEVPEEFTLLNLDNSRFMVGNNIMQSAAFVGLLKNVRVFDVALTPDEVKILAQFDDGISALLPLPLYAWNINEGTGIDIFDKGIRNDRMVMSEDKWEDDDTFQKVMASGTYATNYEAFDLSKSFAISFWVKINPGHENWSFIMSDNANGTHTWDIQINSIKKVMFERFDVPSNQFLFGCQLGDQGDIETDIDTGKWTHIVFTYNAENGQMDGYLNGVLKSSKDGVIVPDNARLSPPEEGESNVIIGNRADLGGPLDGNLARVRFYQNYLNQEQIELLYNKTEGFD